MAAGVIYHHHDKSNTVYFAQPNAMLPVRLQNGQQQLIPWGRRLNEPGELPLGGWANLQSIYHGKWDIYIPKPIRLPIIKFMEKDLEDHVHWYDVTPGQWIQGLLAKEGNECRVYIVTIIPELHSAHHERWPRIVVSV